jgi:Fe-S-cluster containining protein
MTLTESDVARLRVAGHRDFFFVNDDQDFQLENVDGQCVFLVDGRCSVHDDRPQGCRTYPMILDLSVDRVVLDDVCPWSSEFSFSQEDEVRLRKSVIDEESERRLRATRKRSD